MTHVGTEGLPIFREAVGKEWAHHPDAALKFVVPVPTGAALKAKALADYAADRARDLNVVRVNLLAGAKMAQSSTLTADDAAIVAERLGIPTGKWLGAIFRNWPAVEHTGTYVKSQLPRSRARMISVWRIR